MNDLKTLIETFRLSFYESVALLLPGAAFLMMINIYFPTTSIPVVAGIPSWGLFAVSAFVLGYVLKGFWSEVANQYRFRFEPWYRGLKDPTVQNPSKTFYKSKKPLPWYIAPWGLRVILKPLYTFILWSYVDWRKIRIGNLTYLKSAEFTKIKERVQSMYGFGADELKDYEYWSICYGSLSETEQQQRDRFDSIADMHRSLVTIVFFSMGIGIVQSWFSLSTVGIAFIHWVVFRALYNRALRYEILATRNVYRRFFHHYCGLKSDESNT